jgi:hypothetical protein
MHPRWNRHADIVNWPNMPLLTPGSGLASWIVPRLSNEPFVLVDVGCTGGIDPSWRIFEPNLRALGFDPNVQECARLQREEKNRNIEYINAFVAIDPEHPFNKIKGDRQAWARHPWWRMAIAASNAQRAEKNKNASIGQLTAINDWRQTDLADSAKPVILGPFLKQRGISSVDFIKIDVDSNDFEILNSLDAYVDDLGVLGFCVEVNWHGSDHPADHTFHNTDRLLRRLGYELFDWNVRRYSMAALPAPYELSFPAQSIGSSGRPLQGDALYLRDIAASDWEDFAARLTPGKIWKAALLFDMGGMPDSAAEILICFTEHLGGRTVVDPMLDFLAQHGGAKFASSVSYQEYIARFKAEDPAFYPARLPEPEKIPWVLRPLLSFSRMATDPEAHFGVLLALWFTIAAIFQVFGPFTAFGPIGSLDPWIYTGYFTNLPTMAHDYGLLYYPSRFAWIIPGWLTFQILSPASATVVLNAAVAATVAVSLFMIVARHYGRWAGIAAASLLLVNPYFQSSIAGDYPDGPAIAYLAAGIAALMSRGLQARPGVHLFWAGVLLGTSGFTNMIAGFAIAPITLVWLIWQSRHDWLPAVALIAVGIFASAAAHAAVSYVIFGDALFFMPQIRHILYLNDPAIFAQEWGTGLGFLTASYRLGMLYAAVLVAGVMSVKLWRAADPIFRFAVVALVLTIATFAYVEFARNSVVLRVSYTSSYLLVPVHLFLGIAIGEIWRQTGADVLRLRVKLLNIALLVVAGLAVPALYGVTIALGLGLPAREWWWGAIAILIICAMAIAWTASRNALSRTVAPIVLALSVLIGPTIDPAFAFVFSSARPGFDAIMRTQNLLMSGIMAGRVPRFWYDEEPLRSLFDSLSSLYLWGYRDYTREMDTMTLSELRYLIRPNTTFVHLTQDPARVDGRQEIMRRRNIYVKRTSSWRIDVPRMAPFYVVLDEVTDISAMK